MKLPKTGAWTGRAAMVLGLAAGASLLALLPAKGTLLATAVNATAERTTPVEMTVSVLPRRGRLAPAVAASDLVVTQGHARDEVTSFVPAQGPQAGLELLLLIDDSDRIMRVTDQLVDLRAFVLQQPASTAIGVGYMYNGLVHMEQDFTPDHNLAAKAVHMSKSVGAASPYFSLMDMYKRGQMAPNPRFPRREVLMLSDGNDPYSGPFIEDPFVADAIGEMQQSGIEVFTLFVPGADTSNDGYRGGTLLMELSGPTGGAALYSGLEGALISLTPFLDDLTYVLQHQYLLTFNAHQAAKGDLLKVKVETNADNALLMTPDKVYVPGIEESRD